MRIFKSKSFAKWAADEGLLDDALRQAVCEIEQGLLDADLGGHIVKKRVPLIGRGKRGGARTLLAYRIHQKAFFLYGFAKQARANIRDDELRALKKLGSTLLTLSRTELDEAVNSGAFIEVEEDE